MWQPSEHCPHHKDSHESTASTGNLLSSSSSGNAHSSSVMMPLFTCLCQIFSGFDHNTHISQLILVYWFPSEYIIFFVFNDLLKEQPKDFCPHHFSRDNWTWVILQHCVQPLSVRKNTACLQHKQLTIYCLGAICYCFLNILPVRATRWVQPLQTAPIFSCEKHWLSIFLGSARKTSLLTSCPCLLLPQTYRCPSSATDREVKSV